MTCSTGQVSLYWPRCGLTLRPYSANIRFDRGEFNFLRAEFSEEVGDYLNTFTKDETSILRQPQEVFVRIDGVKKYHMYYRPEYVQYNTDGCTIELHDPQKHLKEYIVDKKWENITLKDAYEKVFETANTGDILSDIIFEIPDDSEATFSGSTSDDDITIPYPIGGVSFNGNDTPSGGELTRKILDANFNIDLEDMTCIEAIWEMNNKFGITSWINEDGELHIGQPENSSTMHVAAPDDRRVWKVTDTSISHPRKPIKKVVVKGDMVDSPQDGTLEDAAEAMVGFLTLLNNDEGADSYKDLMPQGVAERTDIDEGQSIATRVKGAKSDSLDAIAYNILLSEMREQHSGTVQIDPQLSGVSITDYSSVSVGDFIHVVPSDGDCSKSIRNEIYVINGVNHDFSEGSWSLNLDVNMYPDNPVFTKVRYFDPMSEDYMDESEVFG